MQSGIYFDYIVMKMNEWHSVIWDGVVQEKEV